MKKVQLIRDKSGAVIASQEVGPDAEGLQGEVVLEDGQSTEVVDVRRSYDQDIDDFMKKGKGKR